VVGFDMVDDESKPERRPTKHMQTPAKWNNPFNPAYSYWAYYVYANLYVLNKVCTYQCTFPLLLLIADLR
jgi:AMP deaminase